MPMDPLSKITVNAKSVNNKIKMKKSKYKKTSRAELLEPGATSSCKDDELEAVNSPTIFSSKVADVEVAAVQEVDAPAASKGLWNTVVEMIGALAGICTTAAFVPQVYEIWITGDTSGLSLPMYSIFVLGVFLWIAYGVCKRAGSLVMANLVTFTLAGYILFAILDSVVLHPENYAEDVDEIVPQSANDSSLPRLASSPPLPPLLSPI